MIRIHDRRTAMSSRIYHDLALTGMMVLALFFAGHASVRAGDHHHHGPDGCSSCASASVDASAATLLQQSHDGARHATGSSSLVCTVFPVYALAQELATGSGRPVHLLLPANLGCPHHYTLTPGDYGRLGQAGLIVANGLGFEPFLDRVTQNMHHLPRIDCAEGIPTIASIEDPSAANAHVFTTPRGLTAMARRLEAGLATGDPANAALYKANRQRLEEMLATKSAELQILAGKLASTPVVLTHDSLDYLAQELGLKVVTHLAVGEGGETSAGELVSIIEKIKREKPVAVLVEGAELPPIVQTLIRETGVRPLHLELLTGGVDQPSAGYIEHHFTGLIEHCSTLVTPR